MGFLDKAKKMAEQAQTKLDEVQKQFNEGQSGPQGPPVEYDQHGRPIRSEAPPAESAGTPPAEPAGPPPAEPAGPPPAEPAGPPPATPTPPHGDPLAAQEPSEPPPPAPAAPTPDPAAPAARDDDDPYTPPKLTGGDPLGG